MHLAILQFFNILVLLPLVTAGPRANSVPVPTAKVWCPLTHDLWSSSTANATQQAYDLLSALSMLGIHCQYGSFTGTLGMNAWNESNPPTGSKLAPVHANNYRNPEHVVLPPRSKISWTFGSVRAYVCNYSEGGNPKTCDITELQAAKEIIEVACGSKLNVNGETWPEPEGGPAPWMQTAVGGVWRSWDEEKEYGFMDAADDSEYCEGILGGNDLPKNLALTE
ncbi:hypothetical protein QBC32DRAFT_401217 [Pseudoneurospora amorphoporcata]|uniref:Uncharacterized protein n=1 Tax=Pseudoneurospora amorphoporcata TaxID=241081 RepID=A0AAN6SCE6_9PEZI|nr:hypothetical protein QBC32DRAFT_401217 [Pseudoneurospora amorphoporcata]